jgi:hypothetical protein
MSILPMPRMRAVSARADVGGVERAWANEKTLWVRGMTLGASTKRSFDH